MEDTDMFVELHMIQNFAPSNLNRDDTGSPKDCEFGGYRRARISSQCLKRAIRTSFKANDLVPEANLASRTKRLTDAIAERLAAQGKGQDEARSVAECAIRSIGLGFDNSGKTQYLLFLGEAEIDAAASLCAANWESLITAAPSSSDASMSAKDAKKAGKNAVSGDVQSKMKALLDGGKAVDLALFGRMLADLPEKNIDAASQVAHAISTNKVNMEFDFFTAVDDLRPEDTAGADMLGTVEFNSACFYRYANVDVDQLARNLGGDKELALQAIKAFVRASVDAIPTGKQNSMAAQNRPSFVMAVVRDRGLASLANAFVTPARPDVKNDLVTQSITKLDEHWANMNEMYGAAGLIGVWLATMAAESAIPNLSSANVGSVENVINSVSQVLRFSDK
jgi:CRISPR system Cascade subunit CasC